MIRGDPARHRDDVLGLSFRNLPASQERSVRRYAKYYERNPAGAPIFFLAHAQGTDAFQGLVALFPTTLWVGGERVAAGINGDLAVDAAHRAFGPAIALERALLAALPQGGVVCAYGRPNPLAETIVKRVGFVDLGRIDRYVKLLSMRALDAAFPAKAALGRVALALRPVADPFLWLGSRERRHPRARTLAVVRPGRFDDRFAALWESTRHGGTVTTARDAALLNWKYELDGGPGAGFSVLALAAPGGEIAAYAVHETRRGVRHVVDLLFRPETAVLDALLAELIRDSRRAGATAISFVHLGPDSLLTARLARFGFLRHAEQDGLWVHAGRDSRLRDQLLDRESWYLLAGDTDI